MNIFMYVFVYLLGLCLCLIRVLCWRAYENISSLRNGQYLHDIVVHEYNFVHPDHMDIHTQNIENLWGRMKRKFKRMCGTSETLFSSYVNEFLWRNNSVRGADKMFGNFLAEIRSQYPIAWDNIFFINCNHYNCQFHCVSMKYNFNYDLVCSSDFYTIRKRVYICFTIKFKVKFCSEWINVVKIKCWGKWINVVKVKDCPS